MVYPEVVRETGERVPVSETDKFDGNSRLAAFRRLHRTLRREAAMERLRRRRGLRSVQRWLLRLG